MNASPENARRFGNNAIPEPKHRKKYLNVVAPALKSPAFNARTRDRVERGNIAPFLKRPRDRIQRTFTLRIQSLASVDDAVERTVQTLKRTGQYDNTILMFASDNGFLLGENGLYAKVSPQRASVRVPLLISGPGFRGGVTSRRWATTPDMAATIAAVAKTSPRVRLDGRSLQGAGARDKRPRTGVLIETGNMRAKSRKARKVNYQGLLIGDRYTYVLWNTRPRVEELYDEQRDPHQMVNVARKPAYRALARAARNELRRTKNCAGPGTCETRRTSWPAPGGGR